MKAGRIPCLVATSSLELGIDMGAVDLVIQVESPKSVARGLGSESAARATRSARSRAGGSSRSSAPTCSSARSSRSGCARVLIEETVIPRNPLDVLAQQIVAICADGGGRGLGAARARSAAPIQIRRGLSRAQLEERARHAPAGRYPSDEFAELRPRDRLGSHRGRSARPARARGGSRSRTRARSPIAGLFGVFIAGSEPAEARVLWRGSTR